MSKDLPNHTAPNTHHRLQLNTLANKLTAVRIAFVPLVVVFLLKSDPLHGFLAAIFFGIAGITDYFDGYYARIQKSVTIIGQLLDPLADKFLVASSLVMLQHLGRIHPIIVILLICREMAITGLRAIASAEGIIIPASRIAKWKTGTQMAAIPMLMLHETYLGIPFQALGTIFTYISLFISLWSAKEYIVDFFKVISLKAKEKIGVTLSARAQKRAARFKKILAKNPDLAKAVRQVADEVEAEKN